MCPHLSQTCCDVAVSAISFKYFPDGRTGGPSFVDCLGCRDLLHVWNIYFNNLSTNHRRIDKHGVLYWFKGLAAKVAIGYVYVVLDTLLMHVQTIT